MLGATYGIYTLVGSRKGGEESVESFFEKAASGKLTEVAAEVGSGSKIRLGCWVAQETPCPKEIDQLTRGSWSGSSGETPGASANHTRDDM